MKKISNSQKQIHILALMSLMKAEIYQIAKKKKDIRIEKETQELAIKLINSNINENLEVHFNYFKSNKIFWAKLEIMKLVYYLRELKFPKEEEFLNIINLIKIKLNENKDIEKEEEEKEDEEDEKNI